MRAGFAFSCAALFTVSLMQGAQEVDMPAEQVLLITNGAQSAREKLSEVMGDALTVVSEGVSNLSAGLRAFARARLSMRSCNRACTSSVHWQQLVKPRTIRIAKTLLTLTELRDLLLDAMCSLFTAITTKSHA